MFTTTELRSTDALLAELESRHPEDRPLLHELSDAVTAALADAEERGGRYQAATIRAALHCQLVWQPGSEPQWNQAPEDTVR